MNIFFLLSVLDKRVAFLQHGPKPLHKRFRLLENCRVALGFYRARCARRHPPYYAQEHFFNLSRMLKTRLMLKREGEIDFYVKCKTCFMGTFANIFTMLAEMMCAKSGQVQTEGKTKKG